MGSRNKERREAKKPKKDTKKIPQVSLLTAPPEVEVIKKGKQREGRWVEEEEQSSS